MRSGKVDVKFGKPQLSARQQTGRNRTTTSHPKSAPQLRSREPLHKRNAVFLKRDLQRAEGVGGNDLSRRVLECSKQTGNAILDKVNKFSNFAKQKKQKAFISKHQFQWKKEFSALKEEAAKAERVVAAALSKVPADLGVLAKCASAEDDPSVDSLSKMSLELNQDAREDRQEMLKQLQDTKDMANSCALPNAPDGLSDAVSERLQSMQVKFKAGMFGLDFEAREHEQALAESVAMLDRWQVEAESQAYYQQKAAAAQPPDEHVPSAAEEMEEQEGQQQQSSEMSELLEHFEEKMLRADMMAGQAMQQARHHFIDACALVRLGEAHMNSEHGGWAPEKHSRFCDIFKTYHKDAHGRQAVVERLRLEMPKLALPELRAHYEWYVQRNYMRNKVKAAQEAQEVQKEEIVAEMHTAVAEAQRLNAEHEAHLEEVERFEAQREEWHRELAKCRQQAELLAVEAEEVEKIRAAREQEEQQAAQLKKEAYLNKQKQLLAAHQQEQEKAAERRREEARQWQQDMETEMARRRQFNQDRVDVRGVMHKQKLQQIQDQQLLEVRDKQDREQRLERLREKVRMYAEEDAERTRGNTFASGQSKDLSKQLVLFKNDGFDVKQLMSDNRFKLAAVLSEAGLGGGKYANEVMMKHIPRTQPKHIMSSINMGD